MKLANILCFYNIVIFVKLTVMTLLSVLTTSVMVHMCYSINLSFNFFDGKHVLFDKPTAKMRYLINLQLCHC